MVGLPKSNEILLVTVVTQQLPAKISVRKRGVTKLDVLHIINYAIASTGASQKDVAADIESKAVEKMTEILQQNDYHFVVNDNSDHSVNAFKRQHQKVWNNLWETGFQISTSKADDAINGDRINATIYAVLSQVRCFEFESSSSAREKAEIVRSLFYAEGCYDSYHTLQVR